MVPWPRIQLPVEIVFAFENALLHFDKLLADHVALLLGLGDAGQGVEEQLAGVFDEEGAGAQVREVPPHEFGFAFAHHAGVDVSAVDPLRAERAQAQRIGHRRIDAAADEEEDVAAGGGLADVFFESVT